LKQRIALRCELRPLPMRESGVYISSRISAVGGVPSQMFTREAVTLIHEFSRGIPRTINVIADNALLGGFARGQRLVNRDIVREVCRDFDISQPPAAVRDQSRRDAMPVSSPDRRSRRSRRPRHPRRTRLDRRTHNGASGSGGRYGRAIRAPSRREAARWASGYVLADGVQCFGVE
jgi:hypothetical protein